MSTRKIPSTITGQLRWYLEHCGETLCDVERATGIHNSMLSRFLRGERGLRLENLDTLSEHLGLRVVRDED